ncbi:MAG: efflux RND transporter permease subunit [Gemmatales bacterium]
MLNAVIRFSLRYRPLVVIASLALLLYGGYLASRMPIDVFPDLDRPRVVIMTEALGLAPEEVESLVTFPLESALLGATGVQDVRSQSGMGLSVVYVEFGWEVDIRVARQTVQERLSTLSGLLPSGVSPQMAPISSIMGQIMLVGLYRRPGPSGGELAMIGDTGLWVERLSELSDPQPAVKVWRVPDRSSETTWQEVKPVQATWAAPPTTTDGDRHVQITAGDCTGSATFRSIVKQNLELRTLADWVIRPRLLKTTGVAQVVVMGGGRKQYQVLADPTALQEYGVSLQEVEKSLRDNNLNASGGFATRGGTENSIRFIARLGPSPEKVVDHLKQVPVKTTPHRTILLDQVARVTEGPQLKRGDASVNGLPGVVMTITKQPNVDTRDLSDRLLVALRETEPSLPADVGIDTGLYQLRGFIDRGIYNVGEALVIGAVLVLIILFLFLMNFRTTFISLTAIPLSLVITVLVFRLVSWLTGSPLSINVMTLGGIAVALGELVDDAIVDVENIFRRLRENSHLPNPRSSLRVVLEASMEVRSAIVFGTATVILVFLPLFALSGIEGRLFTPLGIAYIVSILASLLVSLTVTPVLSYYLLANSKAAAGHGDGPLLRVLKWAAGYLVRFSMKFAGTLLALTWIGVALTAWLLMQQGANFLPAFDEGTVQIGITLPSGASLDATNETAAIVDAKLRSMQKTKTNPNGELLSFVRRSGRAELDEHAEPPNVSEYLVNVNPGAGRHREEVIKELLTQLKEEVPGVDVEVEQPLAHLISHMLSGVTAQIAIKIYGDDLDTLEVLANRIKSVTGSIPGITPPVIEPLRKVDELHIRVKPQMLAFYGLDRAYVAKFVETALQGEVVSQVMEGQRRFDLLVRLEEQYRTDYANLERLRIDLPDGKGQVMLGELADIGTGSGANQVKRDNVRRRIVIRCNALGRDLASVVNDIQTRIRDQVPMPEGYFIEYGGQFESQRRATTLIFVLAGASVVGIFVVLYMLYPSTRVALQILNAIPTAFIGGVLALVLTKQTLTVASLVGFISLGGIAVRNGILLVTHYFHLMQHEGEQFSEKLVLRGSLERLAPVLMTALTAGIGLVPLVVAGQEPGREILYPVATVILGGLITSTFCEFLIHPGLFWRFTGADAERLVRSLNKSDELDEDHDGTTGHPNA